MVSLTSENIVKFLIMITLLVIAIYALGVIFGAHFFPFLDNLKMQILGKLGLS